ncbi:MAG: DUF971 domain-containing protein [Lautropia sp.]|nr:DUF971 domain-containing protein [Lautropia sp.]
MAGLDVNTPTPVNIVVHQRSRELEISFDDGASFRFSFEFLRVHSPSAEVQGHSPEQAVLQHGKQDVLVTDIEPIGHYAIRPVFSDGHDSGLYSWDYLYRLGQEHDTLWQRYLAQLAGQGLSRSGLQAESISRQRGGSSTDGRGGCGGGGCGCAGPATS